MDLKMLWENFSAIAEAENGIQRLRDLILDLAVRGKLVQQLPEEEPASVILEKLRKSNSNKSKKSQSKLSTDKNKLPFDIPNNWEKVKLEEIILEIRYGMTASADFKDKEIKLLRITDIQNNRVNWESVPGCNGEREKAHRYRLKNGDIVIARTGGTIGKSYLVDNLDENIFAVFASYLIKISPVEEMNPYYLKLVLESPIYWKQLTGSTTGTGQPNVNATSLKNFTLPLPPLEEQKRIVSKVDELMELCDRAEASKKNRNELQQQLRRSAIHALETAETEEDFKKSWHFVRDNFSAIVTQANGIKDFRELILDLAVRGKLAPQIPEEGSASVILEKLRKSNSNKPKKSQSKFSIDKNKLPFDVPDNWEKVKLEEIILEIRYGMTASADFQDQEIKLLRITDIQNNRVNWKSVPGCNGEREKAHRYRLKNGDIVIARTGGTIGKSYLVDNLDENLFAVFASYLIKVSPVEEMNSYYLKLVLESQIYWKQLTGSTMGTGQPNVNATSLKNFTLPLPPLEEQKRIVSKVDELMKCCDRVEESLRKKEELASAISASVIHHLEL